jgi:hypothetical protein
MWEGDEVSGGHSERVDRDTLAAANKQRRISHSYFLSSRFIAKVRCSKSLAKHFAQPARLLCANCNVRLDEFRDLL